jgi:hypothetical protein
MRFLDRDNNNTVISKVHSDRFGLDDLRIFQLETCDWGLRCLQRRRCFAAQKNIYISSWRVPHGRAGDTGRGFERGWRGEVRNRGSNNIKMMEEQAGQ